MDERIRTRLSVTGGVATVAELAGVGVTRHVVDDAVRAGDLVRLRRGVVVDGEVWRGQRCGSGTLWVPAPWHGVTSTWR